MTSLVFATRDFRLYGGPGDLYLSIEYAVVESHGLEGDERDAHGRFPTSHYQQATTPGIREVDGPEVGGQLLDLRAGFGIPFRNPPPGASLVDGKGNSAWRLAIRM